jgi:hypothetical protein
MRIDFQATNISWTSKSNPLTYWLTHVGDHKELALFAIRVFELICNSVRSERAWSVMNLIQTPIRGRLSPEKSTKIAYIYINRRQIDKPGSKLLYSTMVDMAEEQRVEYEGIALAEDVDREDDDIKDTRELMDKDYDEE